jgi:hypothetical protein
LSEAVEKSGQQALIAEALRAIANCVEHFKLGPIGDWVDAAIAGDMLSSDEAGVVIGKSADTAVRWFETASADGFPLPRSKVCLFSSARSRPGGGCSCNL